MPTFFLKFVESDPQNKYMSFIDRRNMIYKIPYDEFNSLKNSVVPKSPWVVPKSISDAMAIGGHVINLNGDYSDLKPGNFLKLNQEKLFIKYDGPEGSVIKFQKVRFVELKECTFLKIINENGELKHDFT